MVILPFYEFAHVRESHFYTDTNIVMFRNFRVPEVDDKDQPEVDAVVPDLVLERVVKYDKLAFFPRPAIRSISTIFVHLNYLEIFIENTTLVLNINKNYLARHKKPKLKSRISWLVQVFIQYKLTYMFSILWILFYMSFFFNCSISVLMEATFFL